MSEIIMQKKFVYPIFLICLIAIGSCVLLNLSLSIGFVFSIVIAYYILIKNGFSHSDLFRIIISGSIECKQLYILILLIGATISIWLSSGIVPAMIFYGFEYLKGTNFLLISYLIVSLSAIFMGTAVGTVSTIGIAVLGIGKGFEIPPSILLGVIVSGAYIADKISPISGLLNLTLASTNINYKDALRSMLHTLIPTFVLSALIYYIIGANLNIMPESSNIIEFQSALMQSFNVSPFLLLMPILILIMSFLGVRTIYSIVTGLIGGTIISLVTQKMNLVSIVKSMLFGYRGNTSSNTLNDILVSGGVVSMIEVVIIVLGAVALSSLLEGTGLIKFLTNRIVESIKTRRDLVLKTGLISSILTVITCDQTMGIILPGRLLRKKYLELNVGPSILAKTISDTGTIIAPLMPWNVNSLIIGLVTGISALEYAPFAVLCIINPLITLFFAFIRTKAHTDSAKCIINIERKVIR